MEKTKDLFIMMKEAEIHTDNFLPSKKELATSSKDFALNLVDSGDYNLQEIYSQALRLKEALTNIESVLKSKLPQENFEAFGLVGNYRSGGNSINYSEDEVYAALKKQLDERAELLKVANKTGAEFYDAEGVLVPVVSVTPRKSSLAISF